MTDLPEWITVSFSGGKDSTAMLLHMIENGDHIDEVINIDTGMEFPQMYEHIRKVKSIVEEHGIRLTFTKLWYVRDLGKRFEREIRAEKSQTHLEDYNLVEMMI